MKVLILGNSSIFQRKIFPSLIKFKKISIEVASRRKNNFNKNIKTYKSYNDSIKKSDANIVYISLINSKHFKLALFALKNNKHVIIDKPFTLNSKETNKLINYADKKKLFLSEAVVFHEHDRFKNIIKKINKNKKTNISASFHIPKLKKNNFRNFIKFGGGCFNDMSTYGAYLIFLFLRKKKYEIKKEHNKKNLNEFFSIRVNSRIVNIDASFKFNSDYKNEIVIENNSKKYLINYAFSPPIDKKTYIITQYGKKKEYKLSFQKQNAFDVYFSKIFSLIKKKKYKFFYEEIKEISKIKEKIQ